MLKLKSSELPTTNTTGSRAAKLALFNHYLNHKINSNRTVLENIIFSFGGNYIPERYLIKSHKNSKISDDSLQDIRSLAHLIVWEAADKYLWGSNSKTKIKYKEKFDFCVFASEQVKFKLRTHLRVLNLNRLCGKLPDSDDIRNIYSKLPKLKKDKKYLSNNDYKKIAEENNLKISEIELVDKFITTKTESGDESIKNENEEDNGNRWSQLESSNNDAIQYNKNVGAFDTLSEIEEIIEKNLVIKKFNDLKKDFLKTLSFRDKEILLNTKLKDLSPSKELSLVELSKKFNISSERVRQISEKKFSELKKILIKNKKDLEIN
tara:strand:+ start:3457 stop:4419 length:963 start_codon:yes stop_codon:yes gene_type:complete